MNRSYCIRLASLMLAVSCQGLFAQGSLTPPGPPAPTMRTLDEIDQSIQSIKTWTDVATLPVTNRSYEITTPGYYMLTDNITPVTGADPAGVSIASSNVWLNLNGYQIRNDGYELCILLQSNMAHIVIMNGFLENGTYGILGQYADDVTVDNVHIREMLYQGILLRDYATVRYCNIVNSDGSGIVVGDNSVVSDSTVRSNGNYGVNVGSHAVIRNVSSMANVGSGFVGGRFCEVTGSMSSQNEGDGFYFIGQSTVCDSSSISNDADGIRISDEGHVKHCDIIGNGSAGVRFGDKNRISDCTIRRNAGSGILLNHESVVENCAVTENQGTHGILAGYRTLVQGCNVSKNISTANESYGVYLNVGSRISDCVVGANGTTNAVATSVQGAGIRGSATTVENCTVQYNSGDGIIAVTECMIRNNQVRANGFGSGDGAGIHVTGAGNAVSDNVIQSNDRGLDVDAGGNLIVRNYALNNTTNWDILVGNAILVEDAASAGAFTGDSGGVALGSSGDPSANFTF